MQTEPYKWDPGDVAEVLTRKDGGPGMAVRLKTGEFIVVDDKITPRRTPGSKWAYLDTSLITENETRARLAETCRKACKSAWGKTPDGKTVLLPPPAGEDEARIRYPQHFAESDRTAPAGTAPAPAGVSPRAGKGGTVVGLFGKETPATAPPASVVFSPLRAVPLAPPDTDPWLWLHRIPRGRLVLVSGAPDAGKTTVSVEVAAALSAGRALPGDVARPGVTVAWIGAEDEDGEPETAAMLRAAGADLDRLHVLRALADDGEVAAIASVCAAARRLRPVLAVVDSHVAWFAETAQGPAIRAELRAAFRGLIRDGCTPLLICHWRKPAVDDGPEHFRTAGNAGGLVGAARFVLDVRKDGADQSVVSTVKHNAAPECADVRFRIVAAGLVRRVEWTGETPRAAPAANEQHVPDDQVLAAVDELTAAGEDRITENKLREPMKITKKSQRAGLKTALARLVAAGDLSTRLEYITGADRKCYRRPVREVTPAVSGTPGAAPDRSDAAPFTAPVGPSGTVGYTSGTRRRPRRVPDEPCPVGTARVPDAGVSAGDGSTPVPNGGEPKKDGTGGGGLGPEDPETATAAANVETDGDGGESSTGAASGQKNPAPPRPRETDGDPPAASGVPNPCTKCRAAPRIGGDVYCDVCRAERNGGRPVRPPRGRFAGILPTAPRDAGDECQRCGMGADVPCDCRPLAVFVDPARRMPDGDRDKAAEFMRRLRERAAGSTVH